MRQHIDAPFDIEGWRRSPHFALLRRVGLKPTRQRVAIAERLFGGGDRHVTAEALHEEMQTCRYPPSLATVYNTLRGLSDGGLLREVAVFGSVGWFDTNTGDHYHYYISETQQVVDIPLENIPAVSVIAPAGMQIAKVDVLIRLKRSPGPRLQAAAAYTKRDLF